MFIFTYLRIAKPSFQLTVNSGFRKVDIRILMNRKYVGVTVCSEA